MDNYDLLIVGAGAAGMMAAVAASEAGCRRILLVDRAGAPGGVLPQCIHHGFGLAEFKRELTGPEYAAGIVERLCRARAELALNTTVCSVGQDRTAVLSREGRLQKIGFERMILATGCREIPFGALGIAGTRPAGIFTAGQAQELINLRRLDLGERAVIIGSGDLGMIIARRLVLEGKRVVAMVERRDRFGGMARNYHRCIEKYSVPLICSAEVTRVFGEERISGVLLRRLDSGLEERLSCDMLVTAAGLLPERELVCALGAPPWLSFCGNCSRIHDIVDSAVSEAVDVGSAAGLALSADIGTGAKPRDLL